MKNKKKQLILIDTDLGYFRGNEKEKNKYCDKIIKSFRKALKKKGPSIMVYDSESVRSVSTLYV